MEQLIKDIKKTWLGAAIIGRMDELTTWIGIVGILATPVVPTSWIMMGFALLIFLPDGKFSETFKRWTAKIRGM